MPFRRSSAQTAGDSPVTSRALDLFGWAGRTDVERIQRYTEWSLLAMIWFFLGIYVLPVLPELPNVWTQAVTVALMVLLGVVGGQAVKVCMQRWPARGIPWRERWLQMLVVVLVLAVGWAVVMRSSNQFGLPMAVTMVVSWGFGGLRGRWLHAAVIVGCFLIGWAPSGVLGVGLVTAAFGAFMVFTVQSSLWMLGVVRELDRAKHTQAELAVAQERLRFSSDVHDVMGRHLSTIAVQAELAGAMLRKGDARAAERIEQVRASAHDALREARELARGYRPLDLAQEIEGAVSLLASAGVAVDVQTGQVLAGVPDEWREPVAKVIRESVTNVLRHSRATRVSISLADGALRIANDGVRAGTRSGSPSSGPASDGTGLNTLAADVAARGGRLVDVRDGDSFVLTLTLPGTSPLNLPRETSGPTAEESSR